MTLWTLFIVSCTRTQCGSCAIACTVAVAFQYGKKSLDKPFLWSASLATTCKSCTCPMWYICSCCTLYVSCHTGHLYTFLGLTCSNGCIRVWSWREYIISIVCTCTVAVLCTCMCFDETWWNCRCWIYVQQSTHRVLGWIQYHQIRSAACFILNVRMSGLWSSSIWSIIREISLGQVTASASFSIWCVVFLFSDIGWAAYATGFQEALFAAVGPFQAQMLGGQYFMEWLANFC